MARKPTEGEGDPEERRTPWPELGWRRCLFLPPLGAFPLLDTRSLSFVFCPWHLALTHLPPAPRAGPKEVPAWGEAQAALIPWTPVLGQGAPGPHGHCASCLEPSPQGQVGPLCPGRGAAGDTLSQSTVPSTVKGSTGFPTWPHARSARLSPHSPVPLYPAVHPVPSSLTLCPLTRHPTCHGPPLLRVGHLTPIPYFLITQRVSLVHIGTKT